RSHTAFRPVPVLSIGVIVSHNLAAAVRASQFGAAAPVWNILHQPGVFRVDGALVVAAYPLIPWFAVMALGFCCGGVVTLDPARRRWWMLRLGVGLTLAFLVIRGINIYG